MERPSAFFLSLMTLEDARATLRVTRRIRAFEEFKTMDVYTFCILHAKMLSCDFNMRRVLRELKQRGAPTTPPQTTLLITWEPNLLLCHLAELRALCIPESLPARHVRTLTTKFEWGVDRCRLTYKCDFTIGEPSRYYSRKFGRAPEDIAPDLKTALARWEAKLARREAELTLLTTLAHWEVETARRKVELPEWTLKFSNGCHVKIPDSSRFKHAL